MWCIHIYLYTTCTTRVVARARVRDGLGKLSLSLILCVSVYTVLIGGGEREHSRRGVYRAESEAVMSLSSGLG